MFDEPHAARQPPGPAERRFFDQLNAVADIAKLAV
jgi:hypothetical protein